MASINNQAIRFLEEGETPFNDKIICGCKTQEDWSYIYTDGDTIDFQIDANCEDGIDTILNGGFEEGSSATSITSWTRTVASSENTNVRRVEDSTAPCGTYVLQFDNVAATPLLAKVEQTQTITLGKSYKIKLRAKIVAGGNNATSILEVIVGGVSYYITPTTSWEEYEIIVNVVSTPSDQLVVIKMNETPTDVQTLYVDCFEMFEYADCCLFERVNNGCFELGQLGTDTTNASADNWYAPFVSDTDGLNGTRCAILPSNGDYIEQDNILFSGNNVIKFWAKSDTNGSTMDVYSLLSGTPIETVVLTTTYAQYTINKNTTETGIGFVSTSDGVVYIDCVSVRHLESINITIEGEDTIINVNDDVISIYDNYINISIPINDYNFPSCFQICLDSCYYIGCSEFMKYTSELDACMKQLVWYDSEDLALGINYASGFKNKVRLKAQLQNPTYTLENFVKTTSTTNFISSSKVRKTQELSIDSVPEFMWDRLAQLVAISNVEYDGQELCPSTDSNISINYDKNTLIYSGSVTLSPKDEYIVNRTYNCN